MSISLLDLTRQYVTPEVIDRLATATGETPDVTARAFAGAAPAVLAGMLATAQDDDGLSRLTNLFQQGKFDGTLLDDLPRAFSGSSMDGLVRMGGPLLGSLFGAGAGGLTELLTRQFGVKRTSATVLLSAAAPFVMSVMGRQLLAHGGISASAVRDLLISQRDAIAAAAPGSVATAPGAASAAVSSSTDNPVRRLVPLLIALVAALLVFALMRGCDRSAQVVTPPRDTTTTMAPSARDQALGTSRTATSVP